MIIKDFNKYDEVFSYIMERVTDDIVLRDMPRVMAKAYANKIYHTYPETIMADWAKFQGMSDIDIYEYEKARAFSRIDVAVA